MPQNQKGVALLSKLRNCTQICPLYLKTSFLPRITLFGVWYWLKGMGGTSDPVCGSDAAQFRLLDIYNKTWTHVATSLAIDEARASHGVLNTFSKSELWHKIWYEVCRHLLC